MYVMTQIQKIEVQRSTACAIHVLSLLEISRLEVDDIAQDDNQPLKSLLIK